MSRIFRPINTKKYQPVKLKVAELQEEQCVPSVHQNVGHGESVPPEIDMSRIRIEREAPASPEIEPGKLHLPYDRIDSNYDHKMKSFIERNKTSHTNKIGADMWSKMKRVSIPVFHGNIKDYESWKAAFMACVDRANATNEYKLLQLKQYVAGEASNLISRLGHTAAAYDVALERLERKYGGKRRQIALKMEEVYNFRPIRPGNAKDLENYAELLDITVVSLREADKNEELGDGCLYSQLLRKMTGSMITNYQRWLFELQRQESVETLREWVLKESEFQTVASEVKLGIVERPNDREHKSNQKSGSFFGRKQVNALLDDASTQTYINEDVASELGVHGQRQTVSVNVLNRYTPFMTRDEEQAVDAVKESLTYDSKRYTVDVPWKDKSKLPESWDDSLHPDLEEKVLQWYRELADLKSLYFPRWIEFGTEIASSSLHVFVDASQDAFGAVIYLVSVNEHRTASQLVAAKSHVAPLKAISVPRVELMAAVLGVKLLLAIAKGLEMSPYDARIWSDSMNVLWWIKSHSRSFKPFVANRVGFIQEVTKPSQWMHVPTKLNTADILTKGCKPETLGTKAWLQGPEFLKLDVSQWPKQIHAFQKVEMERKTGSNMKVTMMVQDVDQTWRLDPCRFSDWKRLCRVFAWVYRFLSNSRTQKDMRRKEELDLEEIEGAERKLISEDQKEAFPKEYWALYHGSRIPPKSKLIGLQPFLDETGVMRLNGRLRFAEVLSWEARFPIILPRKSHVTKLIVKHHHEMCHHMGTNTTLASLSSKFWIISSREEIREWENACSWCKKQKAKPAQQLMGNLPKVRVVCSMRAFVQAGVDFAGPFLTVQGRGKSRQKRYLCLFTCLATRAVHLEIAFGLDTNSFLNALFRMAHRRGMPKEIISDNGTNFVGAVKELKELVTSLDSDITKSKLANRGIVWRFNPPNAPHFGGIFESMVKSAKRAIYAVLSSSDVTDEELMTAFTGAEALLNSRPLTYQSAHTQDDVPLTPNHFLHGQLGGDFAPEIDSTSFSPQKRWRRIQELIRHIWRRWMREWLPTLNVRKKWVTSSRDFQVDDVVIVVSQDNPRGTWPMGRILKTYPGKDGHVRVVDVKVGGSRLTRPVTKICPLEYRD
ncbi:uncharacterized protein [Haliotis cracherodii]|uniref:uncharacterized protein n=1 Tax=Haliotis cracherodii TaxID=6455 RepID=UPI0039EA7388